MAFSYRADTDEIQAAKRSFGDKVTDVVFYDPDFPEDGEPWVVIGFDAAGNEIGTRTDDADGSGVTLIPGNRGETVKFWLYIER